MLALFKVITKDMIDLAPTKGVEYVSKKVKVKGKSKCNFTIE